jgi:DNA ligase-1
VVAPPSLQKRKTRTTQFIVDGFRFAHPSATAYFLTHAHSDHYTGLTENWQARRCKRARRVA